MQGAESSFENFTCVEFIKQFYHL